MGSPGPVSLVRRAAGVCLLGLACPAVPAGAQLGAPDAELAEALRDRDPARRAGAVGRLARLATEEAWELVGSALADPEGRVAERAELELGRSPSPAALAVLLGERGLRARGGLAAVRAAEALGRSPQPLGAEPLLRALASRDAELATRVCWAIEQAAAAGRWGAAGEARSRAEAEVLGRVLALAGRGSDERLRARAMACAARLDPAQAAALVRRATRERSRAGLRAAACRLAPRCLEPAEALALATAALADDDWEVRCAAIDALGVLGGAGSSGAASACTRLLETLQDDPRPRLRARALAALRGASGLAHGDDPRPWKAWIAGGARPVVRAAGAAAGPAAPAAERTIALERVVVVSDHVAFLVDLSGSMWMEREGGLSRKAVVDRRFGELLAALDQRTRFLLIPYTREPHPWRERPERATRSNVAAARRSFEGLRERGAGDFWEAATSALAQREIDTLVVLTDGVPTGGDYNDMELVTRLFAERCLTRPVTVDALLIDATRPALARWGALCEATGGRCVPVALNADG